MPLDPTQILQDPTQTAPPGPVASSPTPATDPSATLAAQPQAAAPKQEKKINSPDEAKSVARLLKEGKITGPGRDAAMQALRAFDASAQYESKPQADAKNPAERMGTGEKFARGFAFGAADVGRGIKQAVSDVTGKLPTPDVSIQELRAYATPEENKLSDDELRNKFKNAQQEIDKDLRHKEDVARQNNAGVLNTKAGMAGNIAGGAAATGPLAAAPGGNTLVGAAAVGGAMGAVAPIGSQDTRVGNIAAGAAGGAAGHALGKGIGAGVSKLAEKLAPQAAARSAIAAAKGVTPEAAEALKLGYKLPPWMAKADPTATEHVLGGIAGKTRTHQAMSVPNQDVTNNLGRRSIGLSDGDELHMKDVLDQRKAAGQVYQEVRDLTETQVPGFRVKMKPNQAFNEKLDNISGTFKNYAQRFPSIFKNAKINQVVRDLRKPMTPDEAVQISMKLREDATANYRAASGTLKALGKAQKRAADAIDQLVEDHLRVTVTPKGSVLTQLMGGKNPRQDLFDAYVKSRKIIARTYDIEKVLDDNTGNIDATALARLSKRRPLSGELADIAKFGGRFEGVARPPTKRGNVLGPEISKTEIGVAAVGSAIGHANSARKLATIAAYTGAPTVARKYLLSQFYQGKLKPGTVAYKEARDMIKRGTTQTGALTLENANQQQDNSQ